MTGIDCTVTELLTTPNVFTAFIKIYELELYKGFKCKVNIYNEDNELISTENVVIEGDDYQNWIDDATLEALILSKCNLRKKQEDQPIEEKKEDEPLPVEEPQE